MGAFEQSSEGTGLGAHGSQAPTQGDPRPVPIGRRIATMPIRVYKTTTSPLLGERCKYYPSCSEYAVGAIERYGVMRGAVLACWRLMRCNPWSYGGVDHPEDQRLFRR